VGHHDRTRRAQASDGCDPGFGFGKVFDQVDRENDVERAIEGWTGLQIGLAVVPAGVPAAGHG